MILLDLTNPFTFKTSNDQELSGTFADLTTKQKKELETHNQKHIKLANKVNKLYSKIKRNDKRIAYFESENDFTQADALITKNEELAEKLNAINESHNPNQIANETLKLRFKMSLGGQYKDTIFKIAEEIGYEPVFDVIQKAIAEKKLNA